MWYSLLSDSMIDVTDMIYQIQSTFSSCCNLNNLRLACCHFLNLKPRQTRCLDHHQQSRAKFGPSSGVYVSYLLPYFYRVSLLDVLSWKVQASLETKGHSAYHSTMSTQHRQFPLDNFRAPNPLVEPRPTPA